MQAHQSKALATLMIAAALGACASRGDGEDNGRMDATRRGMTDAAATPLRDVGIIRPDVPDLIESLRYPYNITALSGGCPAIQYEIGQLDAVLGAESYQPGEETTLSDRAGSAASDAAVDAVRDTVDFIPFRGWVRRASGAARAEAEAARAVELGHTRRAFLRGYGSALGCRGVAPAPPPAVHQARREGDAPIPTSDAVTPP